jgi:hypothetical protein
MYFPKFWQRGEHEGFVCWGFSDESSGEARERAQGRARIIAERFHSGEALRSYGYPDRPMREPVLQVMASSTQTEPAGVITRNSYGCMVLNAARMFIADVDHRPTGKDVRQPGILQSFFARNRKPTGAEAAKDLHASSVLQKVGKVVSRDQGGLAFVYETAGGLRVILAHREMDPCSEETGRTLDFVGSDPLYLRLCRNQKSFRARITPKPWRCGHHAPTERWPFLETKSAKSFEAWESEYLRKIQDYSVVRLVERVGDGKIHAEIAPLLALHDEIARADRSDLRLA